VEDAANLVRGHAVDDPWATDIREQDEADAVMELLVHLERVEDVSGRLLSSLGLDPAGTIRAGPSGP